MHSLLVALGSFSIDTSGLISYAEDIFNSLMPVYIPILGIVLGLAIVGLVYTLIKGAVRG
jgi:hypothetical protein